MQTKKKLVLKKLSSVDLTKVRETRLWDDPEEAISDDASQMGSKSTCCC